MREGSSAALEWGRRELLVRASNPRQEQIPRKLLVQARRSSPQALMLQMKLLVLTPCTWLGNFLCFLEDAGAPQDAAAKNSPDDTSYPDEASRSDSDVQRKKRSTMCCWCCCCCVVVCCCGGCGCCDCCCVFVSSKCECEKIRTPVTRADS